MSASAKAVDFSGVKDRGSFSPKHVPDGDYAAKIVKVEDTEAKDGSFMYLFTIKLTKFSQSSYPYYCKLQENQLWKLRNIAVAAGLNVPKKRMKFDPNKVLNKSIGVTMEEDEYEGKMKSTIGAVFPISELADGEEVADDAEDNFDEEAAPQMAGADDDEATEEPKTKAKAKDKAKGGKKKKKKTEEMDISDVD